MNKRTALVHTMSCWTLMAEEAREGVLVDKEGVPGPWVHYLFQCACCEYTSDVVSGDGKTMDCSRCPMKDKWLYLAPDKMSYAKGFFCEIPPSPFDAWQDLMAGKREKTLCIDAEFFCLLIADLAKEALEEM